MAKTDDADMRDDETDDDLTVTEADLPSEPDPEEGSAPEEAAAEPIPADDFDDADTSVPQVADPDTPGDETVEIDPDHLRLIEAVIFASRTALTERQLMHRLPDGANLKGLLKA